MRHALSGPTVFVIDDQKAVREALAEMLSVFGFAVETFPSADRFLAAQPNQQLGCIVADVRMPGTDGVELVRELARRNSRLPVVLISGHADVPMAVAGIKAGAEDFIEKPIDDAKLVAAINRGLARTFSRTDTAAIARRALCAVRTPDATPSRDLRSCRQGLHQPGDRRQARASARGRSRATASQVMEKMQAESVAVLVRQAIRLGRIAA